ncbi:cop9 signalosome complex subunit [Rhizopus azygosporus]|uniref:Cop9 signalosome complex subunit n=1 Tax=Rhizopus azygosporus TaxID=86630 RepID=A0A367J095_RHIAZ|nr:cop9 signalosome complex subunit [Rhizopus azygosporus]
MAERSIELPVNLDFDNYINNYRGYSKIFRSLYIAKKCSQLTVKAYRQAIKDIKENTLDVEKYKSTITELNNVLERKGEPTEALDQSWIDHVRITSKATLESLENELKVAKSKLLKEEMRACYIKLGEFYWRCGDGPAAIRNFVRTRDYCTTNQHTTEMCFKTIKVYLDECNFSHVIQTYLARAETIPNTAQSIGVNSKLKCFQTLTLLGRTDVPKKYRSIANTLIDIPFEACAAFDDVLSPNDVAIYGGLSALASFDRRELQSQVLSNANFKNFLALEPALNELIESFYQSKYTHCFEVLKKYKQQLRLDMYMESNVDHLIQLVHEKAIAQYCVPYSIIDMRKMATAFSIDIETLEEILTDLIGKNKTMAARIDSHNKIVRTKKQNKRTQAFDQSFIAGNDFEKSSRALLLRLNLLKADLIMK